MWESVERGGSRISNDGHLLAGENLPDFSRVFARFSSLFSRFHSAWDAVSEIGKVSLGKPLLIIESSLERENI